MQLSDKVNKSDEELKEVVEPCEGCNASPSECVGAKDCERLKQPTVNTLK